jgi:dTDP-4-amino-4,6-dideoxygalactose transaminase
MTTKPIPFSPPRIDEKTIAAVTEVLRSGWITTGPKTRELERRICEYTGAQKTLCLNSWTNAVELVLRWFGVSEGDEVILPAYTYAATANIVVHLGATPVLVDCAENSFLADMAAIRQAITPRTKVIMPVDYGGLPFDLECLMNMVNEDEVRTLFTPSHENQKVLGRILVVSDAAHSFGATYNGKHTGSQCDVVGFSFHAVKNFTTAEGGAVTLNLPAPFDNEAIWKSLNVSALHGQTKDALSKNQPGQWRYDIVEAGYKCNMTDIQAAIGLVELDRYDNDNLIHRKALCEKYTAHFKLHDWANCPMYDTPKGISSYHLYPLRITGFSEAQRDELIVRCAEVGISTNVHFQPIPLLTFYKNKGYKMSDFPNAWAQYSNEISLPVFYDLTLEQVDFIAETLIEAVNEIRSNS